jgi:hypothetical protein
VALRELAVLVARRRGFHVEKFVADLMRLYSESDERNAEQAGAQSQNGDQYTNTSTPQVTDEGSPTLTPRRLIRHFKSQPFLSADESRRRHFSFEPGDDQLKALDDELKRYAMRRPRSPAGSQSTNSSGTRDLTQIDPKPGMSTTLSTDNSKPSKIPSPLQRPSWGNVRRENSGATFPSPSNRRGQCDRRDSSSSVRTAIRNNSNANLQRLPLTRGSSSGNSGALQQTEESQQRERSARPRLRNGVVALATARVTGGTRSSPPESMNNSPARVSSRGSTIRTVRRRSAAHENQGTDENSVPQQST